MEDGGGGGGGGVDVDRTVEVDGGGGGGGGVVTVLMDVITEVDIDGAADDVEADELDEGELETALPAHS
jgi:hypothetical protein